MHFLLALDPDHVESLDVPGDDLHTEVLGEEVRWVLLAQDFPVCNAPGDSYFLYPESLCA